MHENIRKTHIFEGFAVHAIPLSADFGMSFSTVGCWAACGRLWVAIEGLWVARGRHRMLFGTSTPRDGSDGSRSCGLETRKTIVNGAKFRGLKAILQNQAKTAGKQTFGIIFATMSCWVAKRCQITRHWSSTLDGECDECDFLQG